MEVEMELEKEFTSYKVMRVFDNAVQRTEQMAADLNQVDIPEFAKMPEDRITTKADNYVAMLINENRLDTEFKKILYP